MLELCVSLTSNTECSHDPVMVTIEAEGSRNGTVGKVATPPYVRLGHLHVWVESPLVSFNPLSQFSRLDI